MRTKKTKKAMTEEQLRTTDGNLRQRLDNELGKIECDEDDPETILLSLEEAVGIVKELLIVNEAYDNLEEEDDNSYDR